MMDSFLNLAWTPFLAIFAWVVNRVITRLDALEHGKAENDAIHKITREYYDLEKRLQSEDRAHRIGQTGSVTYVDLVAEKTIDEKIIKALKEKVDLANDVMVERDIKKWLEF